MSIADKRVLVTGADGFIGSHLCELLVRQGARVRALALYNSFGSHGWLDSLPHNVSTEMEICLGDIRDPGSVQTAMRDTQVVFHLAALIGIPYSYHCPDSYVDTNIKGSLNILKTAQQLRVERVIHTSTSEVYGTAQYVPINEEHPLHAQSPYAASKIAADQLALSYYYSFQTPVVVLRPFNTYGPRQSTRAIIPTIITQIMKGQRLLTLGRTTPSRDFLFVADTVRAFVATAEAENAVGRVVHVGSGFEITISHLAQEIAAALNVSIELTEEKERVRPEASEVQRLVADNRLAAEILGWRPDYCGIDGLQAGLKRTIAWFSNSVDLPEYRRDIYQI